MTVLSFQLDDGGRAAAGFKGTTGDCVIRAIAIATGLPYRQVYDEISAMQRSQRQTKHTLKGARSVRNGTYTKRKWFKTYMCDLGWVWTPTMEIGTGCRVHLADNELPGGRLIVSLSRHYTAIIDGVIHDAYDPRRTTIFVEDGVRTQSERCVYGYWQPGPASEFYLQ